MDGGSVDSRPVVFQYDRATLVLHWLTAGLIVATWVLGFEVDSFPRGVLKVDARSAHFLLGAIVAVILAIRLARQWTMARPAPFANRTAERSRRLGHAFLYAFLALQLVFGFFTAWSRGDSIFNLFTLPKLAADNRAVRTFFELAHLWSSYLFLAVVGAHAVIALVHHYLLRDGVLGRMIAQSRIGRRVGGGRILDLTAKRLWLAEGAVVAVVMVVLGWQAGWFNGGDPDGTFAPPPVPVLHAAAAVAPVAVAPATLPR